MSIIGCPLVENEDNQVAKEGAHENHFWDKSKVDVQWLLKIAAGEKAQWYMGLASRTCQANHPDKNMKSISGTELLGLTRTARAGPQPVLPLPQACLKEQLPCSSQQRPKSWLAPASYTPHAQRNFPPTAEKQSRALTCG